MAAHGYPGQPRKGDVITRPARSRADGRLSRVPRRHRGCEDGKELVTNGGRVLCVDRAGRLGARWRSAAPTKRPSASTSTACRYRQDIGHRAIKHAEVSVDMRMRQEHERDATGPRLSSPACRSASSPRWKQVDGKPFRARRMGAPRRRRRHHARDRGGQRASSAAASISRT